VHLDFNKTYWDGTNWSDTYTDASGIYDYGNYSKFGSPIPEPATIIVWNLLGLTAVGFGYWRWKRAA